MFVAAGTHVGAPAHCEIAKMSPAAATPMMMIIARRPPPSFSRSEEKSGIDGEKQRGGNCYATLVKAGRGPRFRATKRRHFAAADGDVTSCWYWTCITRSERETLHCDARRLLGTKFQTAVFS